MDEAYSDIVKTYFIFRHYFSVSSLIKKYLLLITTENNSYAEDINYFFDFD